MNPDRAVPAHGLRPKLGRFVATGRFALVVAGLAVGGTIAGTHDEATAVRHEPGPGVVRAIEDPELSARITSIRSVEGARAGSGLAWLGDHLLVVQDDAPEFVVVDPATARVVNQASQPQPPASKAEKPDYEAVFEVEPGHVVVLGSGSAPPRRKIARLGPAAVPEIQERGALYDALSPYLDGQLNIEGAVRSGEVVYLLHREVRRDRPGIVFEVPLAAIEGGPASVASVRHFDLGRVEGVPLAFTDATPLDARRLLYLAVAEDTPNPIDDGPIRGAAIGIIDGNDARWTLLLEADGTPSVRKPEGILLDPSGREGWLVTDPDDAAQPAELCRFRLEGDAWAPAVSAGSGG